MSSFKDLQYQRQEKLIETSDIFNNDPAHGMYRGKERPFVLMDGMNNLYAPIRSEVVKYFRDNKISWWGGYRPTGHTLSSQVACLNHLFADYSGINVPLVAVCNVPPVAQCNVPPQKWLQ